MNCMKKVIKKAKIITDGKIIVGHNVLIDNEKIVSIDTKLHNDCEAIDLEEKYLLPGLIDLHCHGGNGFEFIDGTEESIRGACDIHAAHGTKIIYPTISATDYDTMYRSLEAIEKIKDDLSITVPGVHLEGPYLSLAMCGAQNGNIIRMPDENEYRKLYERFGALIKRWDYAPENDADCKFVSFLKENGIVSATAHSAAQYKDVIKAYEKGNRLVTHLYSCTSTIVREGGFRKLGIIESAFLLDGMYAEVIGDGCHIPAELMQMIFKIKGADRLCLVSDAIRFAGYTQSNFSYTKGSVRHIIEDGVAKLADRSAFAGSIATADVLIKRTVEMGISLPNAVKMMSETPAKVMGLKSKGRIAPGFDADFTVLDAELNACNIKLI